MAPVTFALGKTVLTSSILSNQMIVLLVVSLAVLVV